MSDKELIELAAIAASIEGDWTRFYEPYGDSWTEGIKLLNSGVWNPLRYPGQTFALATTLAKYGIRYQITGDDLMVECRAITEAAAVLGRMIKHVSEGRI